MKALPRCTEALASAVESGASFEVLLFYGHRPDAHGLGKGCLSNWWPCRFALDGRVWASTEQWMMYEKARLFGDVTRMEAIAATEDPGRVKALGREVTPFGEASWAAQRYAVMVRGLRAKFTQDGALAKFLAGTRGKVLAEASPSDRVWGIGLREGDEGAQDPRRWRGANLLGFALMDVRDEVG